MTLTSLCSRQPEIRSSTAVKGGCGEAGLLLVDSQDSSPFVTYHQASWHPAPPPRFFFQISWNSNDEVAFGVFLALFHRLGHSVFPPVLCDVPRVSDFVQHLVSIHFTLYRSNKYKMMSGGDTAEQHKCLPGTHRS